jgi:hypothetical protein
MPPPPGGTKKKKKGRSPAHQNTFAFRHNPKSKKTEKILSSPNVGVCTKCHDKIEWRKKYRKYKPLTQPAKCNVCNNRSITAAYHTICGKCAVSDGVVVAMLEKQKRLLRSDACGSSGGGGGDNAAAAAAAAATDDAIVDRSNTAEVTAVTTANDEIKSTTLDLNTIPPPSTPTTLIQHHHRHMRVCGICTSDWATSEFSNISSQDMDLVHTISTLEETILSGLHIVDGHKLSVREIRGVEREVEKLRDELHLLKKKKTSITSNNNTVVQHGGDEDEEEDYEEGDEEVDDDDDDNDEVSSNDNDNDNVFKKVEEKDDDNDSINDNDGQLLGHDTEEIDDIDDPFLIATKGKALVGEEYRQMLLANQWKSTSKNY